MIPADEERCQAMRHRPPDGGSRCQYRRVGPKLCRIHEKWGALIPDDWTPSGIPVFALTPRRVRLSG
jgi:hypothetical protein